MPFAILGWDTNYLYLACLVAAMGLVLARAPAGLRPFVLTGLLGAASIVAFTVGGSADLLYALPLVAAWLWRERRWSALALGAAIATKQVAWLVAPFYLITVISDRGFPCQRLITLSRAHLQFALEIGNNLLRIG